VAIVLHDHTEINADAELDALVRRKNLAVSNRSLHSDSRSHRIHNRGELDQEAMPGRLDDAPAIGGDYGIDQVLANGAKTFVPSSPAPTSRL
jgi:hypothetical protein